MSVVSCHVYAEFFLFSLLYVMHQPSSEWTQSKVYFWEATISEDLDDMIPQLQLFWNRMMMTRATNDKTDVTRLDHLCAL